MALSLKKINIYNEEISLFKNFSLEVSHGEIQTIMGPSGCGKSTLLAFICGALDKNDFHQSGEIYLEGKEISNISIQKRKIGILFQDDLLFPHMNVQENLYFALPSYWNRAQKKAKITSFLKSAQLEKFGERDITTLSGGQKARISLLRALLAEPKALLLDEPFSKLDANLKKEIKKFVFNLIKKAGIPTILVTHNKEDIPIKNKNKVIYLK